MSRPYFNLGSAELERLFNESLDDLPTLEALVDELSFRSARTALRLRERAEKVLARKRAGSVPPPPRSEPPEQMPLFEGEQVSREPTGGASGAARGDGTRTGSDHTHRARAESTDEEDVGNARGIEFKLIEPTGVSGKPSKWMPPLDEALSLDLPPNASTVKRYRAALKALVREMKRSGAGSQSIALQDGSLLQAEGDGFAYVFPFADDAVLFEGASVELAVNGSITAGQIASISGGRLVLTVQDDLGATIPNAVLRVDSTALLVALEERLGKVEDGEAAGFNLKLAEAVTAGGKEAPTAEPNTVDLIGANDLNPQQRRFVTVALANDVSYLWGPPGTGKTQTLTSLVRTLYAASKRVLICSNTNKAVDQVILKLCQALQDANDPALQDGAVIRVGRIAHTELREVFEDKVVVDKIVERKSEELQNRKRDLEAELNRIAAAAAPVQRDLAALDRLDAARAELAAAEAAFMAARRAEEDAQSAISAAQDRLSEADAAIRRYEEAGPMRRAFMKNERALRAERAAAEAAVNAARAAHESAVAELSAAVERASGSKATVDELIRTTKSLDRAALAKKLAELTEREPVVRAELSDVIRTLDDVRHQVMETSKVIGATITKLYLSPSDFSAFDVVIVDEASMVLLPALFHAAGMAKEHCVVVGDFQQLAPIVQTRQKAIWDILGNDVFEAADIADSCRKNAPPSNAVMLDEQYRMNGDICDLISTNFYNGLLRTSPTRRPPTLPRWPSGYDATLTIVDTSRVIPFSNRDPFRSRFNLLHALAVRNLALSFRGDGFITDPTRLGICSPYAAQAKLLRNILKGHDLAGMIEAGTVHRYQGDEKAAIILDIPDGWGERSAGLFLQADTVTDDGAKLLNVAISRAQEHLIVVANLTWLNDHLPSSAFLRDILFGMQNRGRVIDVRDMLALHPIEHDLRRNGAFPLDLDPEVLRSGIFGETDFDRVAAADIQAARETVAVYSGFITPARVARYGDLLRQKVDEGVRIRCITRPPDRNGSIPVEQGREAINLLESLGAAVDLRDHIHQKAVLIDDRITWLGSLNFLSYSGGTSEMMVRVDDPHFALQTSGFLAIRRPSPNDDLRGKAADKENGVCRECGAAAVFGRGKYGRYFRCERDCGWWENVDRPGRGTGRGDAGAGGSAKDAQGDSPDRPECGSSMRLRTGPRGSFYGCSRYPDCRGTVDASKAKNRAQKETRPSPSRRGSTVSTVRRKRRRT